MSPLRFSRHGAVCCYVIAGLLALGGCGGSSNSGSASVPTTVYCGNDSSYALARPLNGGTISAGTPSVEIVASGNNNQLGQSYQSFNLLFVPRSNAPQVQTGGFAAASDPSGYHPFASDFYYSGTVQSPGLFSGQTYDVYLNAFSTNCTPNGPIGAVLAS